MRMTIRAVLWRIVLTGLLIVPILAFGAGARSRGLGSGGGGSSGPEKEPFERTEDRARCRNYTATRQPFFGELHLHTQYSFDAAAVDTRNTPRDAYRFAKGEKVGLPPWADTRIDTAATESLPGDGAVSAHPYCLPPDRCQYTATRTIQFPAGRALDFAAVTDHSEQLGETNICLWEGTESCSSAASCQTGQTCRSGRCVPEGYDSELCTLIRSELSRLRGGHGAAIVAGLYNLAESPSRAPFCGLHGENCVSQASNVWGQIIRDAEDAYDRTNECRFTSFIGYEYTAMPAAGACATSGRICWDAVGESRPSLDCGASELCLPQAGGDNLHRNIIFRNRNVLPVPISNIEAPAGCGKGPDCINGKNTSPGPIASPERMLRELRSQCNAIAGCDVISIPHNANLSGGAMFLPPETLDEAKLRHEMEPLTEMFQIKGQSECRFSSRMPGAWDTVDELCNFENMSFSQLVGSYIPNPDGHNILPGSYIRNALKAGLKYEQANGVNPFRLGAVGGLDNHNGTPGATDGYQYAKTGGHGVNSFAVSGQILNETYFLGLETNGGGLTVAWAEENSRDSIFSAFKRRETYATSGTRPVVRFFGGFDLPSNLCSRGDFVRKGYDEGVPMGGCLTNGGLPGEGCKSNSGGRTSSAPSFAVLATMDPGTVAHPGTPLQRVQVIKGWVDAAGETHEAVYDVAGDAGRSVSVDLQTCEPQGRGDESLCGVWKDPKFDPNERAFYYARVVENPSCRWNQYYCNARGIDCSHPAIPQSINDRYTEWEYQQCCSDKVPKTAQQRAVTSPIWYAP